MFVPLIKSPKPTNHLYSHKPYTTVQRRHKYTYNKYRIDINIYTVYTTKTWV
jgi:hypothetical protein